tara:strand:+ start:1826 stop:3448 length:1623 start_codon:yes stop_codon:yes gene_type:complete
MAYTREQMVAAGKKAVAAGDNASANEIADMITALDAEVPQEEQSLFAGMVDTAKDVKDTVGGVVRGATKGFSFGAAKPINAGIYAAGQKLTGDERPMGEIFDDELAQEQAQMDEFAEENAGLAMGAEIGGALLSPINKALGLIKLGKGAIATTGTMAAQGAVGGTGYVFLDTNGSVVDRLDAATSVAVPSAMFGVVGGKVMAVSTDVFKSVYAKSVAALAKRRGNAPEVSTTQVLKDAKNAAYELVKKSNIRFNGPLVNKAKYAFVDKVQQSKNYSADSTIQKDTFKLIAGLSEDAKKRGVELIELDRTQQSLWKKYKAAKVKGDGNDQSIVLDAINMIDDLIQAHPNTSEAMSVARATNRQFRKAETIDRIVAKIKLDESFKGQSNVDQMKAALVKIINSPRDSKHYDAVEIDRFKEFIADSGTHSQKFLASLGKMAPTNALNQIFAVATASAIGGTTGALGVTGSAAATTLAKKYAQGASNRRTGAFTSEMQGNARTATAPTRSNGLFSGQFAGGVSKIEEEEKRKRDMSMLKRNSAF